MSNTFETVGFLAFLQRAQLAGQRVKAQPVSSASGPRCAAAASANLTQRLQALAYPEPEQQQAIPAELAATVGGGPNRTEACKVARSSQGVRRGNAHAMLLDV